MRCYVEVLPALIKKIIKYLPLKECIFQFENINSGSMPYFIDFMFKRVTDYIYYLLFNERI